MTHDIQNLNVIFFN